MKKWETPEVSNLSLDKTNEESNYETVCTWNDGIMTIKNEYKDPNNKPTQHPDWVWCKVHKQWHPKVHNNKNDYSGMIS